MNYTVQVDKSEKKPPKVMREEEKLIGDGEVDVDCSAVEIEVSEFRPVVG